MTDIVQTRLVWLALVLFGVRTLANFLNAKMIIESIEKNNVEKR